jgi:DHA1 family bicyclomycin/chloramphenicol resistance-like MFS transporter
MLIALGGTMGLHMLVPALPRAGVEFSASAGAMQLNVSAYVVGMSLGQLFYGPLSDAYGRRRVLLAGIALSLAGSAIALMARQLEILLLARILQALGSCAGLALARAIVRDTTRGDATLSGMATLNVAVALSPGLAPLVGGLLTDHWGWRSIFLALLLAGGLTLLLTWAMLRETGQPSGSFHFSRTLENYRALLGSARFAGLALATAGPVSVYAIIAAAPFIFMERFQQSASSTGVYTGLMIAGTALGNALLAFCARRVAHVRLVQVGSGLCIASVALLLALESCGLLSVANLVPGVLVFSCGTGLIYPVALAKALEVSPRIVGSAAGLFGCLQMAIGAICSMLVTLGSNPAISAFCVMGFASALGLAAFSFAVRRISNAE